MGSFSCCWCKHHSFVRGFQPLPRHFLRHPSLDPACPLVFKIFASPPLFSVLPPFKVFQTIPHHHATPYCPNPIQQPSFHIIKEFKQYQKSDLTTSTVSFYQISISYIYIYIYIYVDITIIELSLVPKTVLDVRSQVNRAV